MSRSEHTAWYVKIPPPIWMLAMVVCAFGVDRLFVPGRIAYSPTLAAACAAIGVALDLWAFAVFRAAGTEILPASTSNKALIVRGPYRGSRNPMYLGLLLIAAGIAFAVGSLPYFAVPLLMFWLCNALFIPFEEAKMQRQFGSSYTDYLARVRRWI